MNFYYSLNRLENVALGFFCLFLFYHTTYLITTTLCAHVQKSSQKLSNEIWTKTKLNLISQDCVYKL